MANGVISEASIAYKCSASLKHEAISAAIAACEAVNPQVRQLFLQACQEAIQAQGQIADLMVQKGWYVPLQATAANMDNFMQNLQQWTAGAPGAHIAVGGVGAQAGGQFGAQVGGQVGAQTGAPAGPQGRVQA